MTANKYQLTEFAEAFDASVVLIAEARAGSTHVRIGANGHDAHFVRGRDAEICTHHGYSLEPARGLALEWNPNTRKFTACASGYPLSAGDGSYWYHVMGDPTTDLERERAADEQIANNPIAINVEASHGAR